MNLTNDCKCKKNSCGCKEDKVQQGEKGPPSERSKGLIPAVPPVLKNVGKLAAGVAGMASGSATEKEDHQKCKRNENTANTSKHLSACIEYGFTKTAEFINKIQFKEMLNTTRDPENKNEETGCCNRTCKKNHEVDNPKNQKVKFQETNNLCSKNIATYNKKCAANESNKTDANTCKSSNFYSKIDTTGKEYDGFISKKENFYSCGYKCTGIKNDISKAIKSSPDTPYNLKTFEAPKTLFQTPNFDEKEACSSGIDTNRNQFVSNNINLFEVSNTLLNKKPPDDLVKLQVMPKVDSTKFKPLVSNTIDLFDTSKKNRSNNNFDNKKLSKFENKKTELDPTKDASLSNNIDLFKTSNRLDNATQSEPTFSKDIDLFAIENEREISTTYMEKLNNSKRDRIDLFQSPYIGQKQDSHGIVEKPDFPKFENKTSLISKTKSTPVFADTVVYIDALNDMPDLLDMPDLPEIKRDKKYERFYIRKRCLGVNNCKCKNDNNGYLIGRETCKIYTTTMLGMNACSHVGNPRNKTALQPGHSLMDWIRLSHSGQDLTGVGPRAGTLSVSPKQLAEHTTEDNAWIAIRGKVYNVTAYFDFHPGGREELMKGAGQDATQMFNAVHPWVNYESILQKCLVGRLTAAEVDEETYSLFYGRSNQTIKVPKNFRVVAAPPASINSNGELPTENTSTDNPPTGNDPTDDHPTDKSLTNIPIIENPDNIKTPKFDWIQQFDNITTIFYTNALNNPEVQVTAPTKDNKLDIIFIYDDYKHKSRVQFSDDIHWPCRVTINWDTGKIEINFRKIIPKIWNDYGTLTQTYEKITENYQYEKIKYVVLNNVKENHNTHLIAFQRIDGVKQTIPIGYHVKVYGSIDDQELIRCYTPVPCNFMRKYSQDYEAYRGDVCLLVKIYPEGLLSPTICNSVKGDVFEFSPPIGCFNMEKVANRSGYLFLAAGSGITPMLAIIKLILESTILKCEKMCILYFNRSEEDIILRLHFDTLVQSDKRVKVKYILSHPSPKWSGLSGHIDLPLLKSTIDEQCTNSSLFPVDIFSLICGPLVFTNLAKSILVDIGYTDENIHVFGS